MAKGKIIGGAAGDLFASAGVAVYEDARIALERSAADRFREPSILAAIAERGGSTGANRPALDYEAVCYRCADCETVARHPDVHFDKLAGLMWRRFATLSEATDWAREHCIAWNVYRWQGAERLWCAGADPEADKAAEGGTLDYEGLTAAAQAEAPAGVRVDMSRAESVSETYWIFAAGSGDRPERRGKGDIQIGVVVRDGTAEKPWRADRIAYGMPVARQLFVTRGSAIAYAASGKRED